MNAIALGTFFALDAQIVKITGVPERVEVTLQPGFIVRVAGLGKDTSANGIRGDAAVAVDHDLLHHVLLRLQEGCQKCKKRQQKGSQRRISLDAMEGLIQTRNDNYLKLLTS